jgi:hypothetical protein
MVSPMLDRLYELAQQTENPKVASECVRDALDRAGIGALVEAKVRQSHRTDTSHAGITVNIGFLGAPPLERSTPDAGHITGNMRAQALVIDAQASDSD